MQLYLVRHPKPLAAAGICYGRSELALDPCSLLGTLARVRAEIPAHVLMHSPIYTSPSGRCLEFARRLAPGRAPTVVDELAELDFGAWEGASWERIPRAELDAWSRDVWGYAPGGAESAAMVARRWERWAAHLSGGAAGSAVAVTHAGLMRVALASVRRLDAGALAAIRFDFGAVCPLELAVRPRACVVP